METPIDRIPKMKGIQHEVLRKNLEATVQTQPGIAVLRKKLLECGGKDLCVSPDRPDPDLKALIERGYLMTGSVICKSRGMESNRCHENISRLWLEKRKRDPLAGIATGYCLSGDVWGQHSWGVRRGRDARIVETLGRRDMYFGILLTGIDADVFAFQRLAKEECNWPLFNVAFMERVRVAFGARVASLDFLFEENGSAVDATGHPINESGRSDAR